MDNTKQCPSCKKDVFYRSRVCIYCKYDFITRRNPNKPKKKKVSNTIKISSGGKVSTIWSIGWYNRRNEDFDFLDYDKDETEEDLLEWAEEVYETWLDKFNERLMPAAIEQIAESSERRFLRKNSKRLLQLIETKRKGKRTKKDHLVCPFCNKDWNLHFKFGCEEPIVFEKCGAALRV